MLTGLLMKKATGLAQQPTNNSDTLERRNANVSYEWWSPLLAPKKTFGLLRWSEIV